MPAAVKRCDPRATAGERADRGGTRRVRRGRRPRPPRWPIRDSRAPRRAAPFSSGSSTASPHVGVDIRRLEDGVGELRQETRAGLLERPPTDARTTDAPGTPQAPQSAAYPDTSMASVSQRSTLAPRRAWSRRKASATLALCSREKRGSGQTPTGSRPCGASWKS